MTFLLALSLALALSLGIEAVEGGCDRPVRLAPGDLALRLGAYALIMLFWFVFSWRPWLAATSLVLTVAGLSLVSRLKRGVIGEPLVFSDFALLPQVPRHPDLYYTKPLTHPTIAGPLAAFVAVVALWYWIEPTALPRSGLASVGAIVALPLALSGLMFAAERRPLSEWLARRFPAPDLEADIARFGLPATILAYTLRWRKTLDAVPEALPEPHPEVPRSGLEGGLQPAGRPLEPSFEARLRLAPQDEVDGREQTPAGDLGAEIVVVIQLESFVDPERLGGMPLPVMELIRTRAVQYGRLRVPAHGAYTMRTEHAVITGRDAKSLGFGVFDPYLAAGGREPDSLARRAVAAGYETVFVHPFHRDFFDRARVVTEIGFQRLVMEDAFSGTERIGPYVGDVALGHRILAEVAARKKPIFLLAVTMENHGPWKPGRLPGIDDPLAQYLHHVAHTGRMVEDLVAGLSGLDAVLCVYGDHAPALPTCRPGFGGTTTDYAIFRCGRSDVTEPQRVDLTADALGRALRATLGSPQALSAGSSVAVPRW